VSISLVQLKESWNDVLDRVERANRVAWLAYFDARLVSLEDGVLLVDFSDPAKLSGGHDYSSSRSANLRAVLEKSIEEVTGEKITVSER
jgi:hypothetical protein